MGTNSHIFYEDSSGVFRGISCNFDGNLNGVGVTLFQHYQSLQKIKELISLGPISSLDKECSQPPEYYSMSLHEIEKRQFGYTFAYSRDLKDSYIKPYIKNSLAELEKYYNAYVWTNNQWYKYNTEQAQWKILKEELIELYQERSPEYLIHPKTLELQYSYDEYMENVRRGFLLIKKETTHCVKKDYIKLKATQEQKPYEILLQVVEVIENEAIREDYQLIILSNPSKDFAWFYPVVYPQST